MNTIPTILVPIDFTECSINALVNAIPIARKKQAKIIALHIIDINTVQKKDSEFSAEENLILKTLENKYQNLLLQIKNTTQHFYQFEIETMVKTGSIEDLIKESVTETNSFLIVIGTHGTGSKTSLLGSTAQSIVRATDCALLAIPRAKKHSVFTKIFFHGRIKQDEKMELLKTISQNDDTIMEITELINKENEGDINDLNSKFHLLENNLKEVNLKSSDELQIILKQLNQKTYPLKINVSTILDNWDVKTVSTKVSSKASVPVFSIA